MDDVVAIEQVLAAQQTGHGATKPFFSRVLDAERGDFAFNPGATEEASMSSRRSVPHCNVLFMTDWQPTPQGLAEVAPGPELAQMLAGIELSALSGYDCVEVFKAQSRQVNHERARLMATMVEVGLCGVGHAGGSPRMAMPDEFSADEIRAALMLTRRAADAQSRLGYFLVTRLPAVHAAMAAGVLDEPARGSCRTGPLSCIRSRPARWAASCYPARRH